MLDHCGIAGDAFLPYYVNMYELEVGAIMNIHITYITVYLNNVYIIIYIYVQYTYGAKNGPTNIPA